MRYVSHETIEDRKHLTIERRIWWTLWLFTERITLVSYGSRWRRASSGALFSIFLDLWDRDRELDCLFDLAAEHARHLDKVTDT